MKRSSGMKLRALVIASVLLGACGDAGPVSGPGQLTATVVSPNGAEGAARLTLIGTGIGAVSALDGRVFAEQHGDTVNVVLVNTGGGDLRFRVTVADTTQPPLAVLIEVADTADALRALAGYSVEVLR